MELCDFHTNKSEVTWREMAGGKETDYENTEVQVVGNIGRGNDKKWGGIKDKMTGNEIKKKKLFYNNSQLWNLSFSLKVWGKILYFTLWRFKGLRSLHACIVTRCTTFLFSFCLFFSFFLSFFFPLCVCASACFSIRKHFWNIPEAYFTFPLFKNIKNPTRTRIITCNKIQAEKKWPLSY